MKQLKFILSTIILLYIQNYCIAQESPTTPPFVSPYYFGPNAFPVPDILTKTNDKLKIGIAYDYYLGKKSNTQDVMIKTNIPLWTRRANLSLWWPLYEWYNYDGKRGGMSGDVYVSIDLQLLEESKAKPNWTMRAALKTASGGGYQIGRYYDCPGYYFDTYFGKTFNLSHVKFQLCGGGGFLCWQTDNGQQNDAIQYGILIGASIGHLKIEETFGGYSGWQSNQKNIGHLVHDRPMTLKTDVTYSIKNWEMAIRFQHGLIDYPFTQIQLGINYSIDILNRK